MSLNDPISNMLTSIRNAMQVKKETVDGLVSIAADTNMLLTIM